MLPKQIHIPNPCHEDWSKMTPTEKGAFCTSCKKEVLDFTELSNKEIKNSLSKADKPCIRVTQKKLDELNFLEWFNHLRLKTQLKYVFLIAFLVAQSSLMAQESICHEPQFVAVDSSDNLSFDQIHEDIIYRPIEEEIPFYHWIWGTAISGEPINWGWAVEEEYYLNVTESIGGVVDYNWFPNNSDWILPKDNYITANPEVQLVYGSIVWTGDVGNIKDVSRGYLDKTASHYEKLKVGMNSFEFEILENQLFFSYDAIQEQEIHLKIGQDQYGPYPSSHHNTLFSGPLTIAPGNKTIIIPLNGYLPGTYFIQINSGHLQDIGRLIYF